MPVTFKVSVIFAGDGHKNFSGVFSVSYPEMNIHDREFTFLATKFAEGGEFAVAFSRDGEFLFSINKRSKVEFNIHAEEEYGKTLDGKEMGGLEIMMSFAQTAHFVVKNLLEQATKDASVLRKGVSFAFRTAEITDERAQEILCLICGTRKKEEKGK